MKQPNKSKEVQCQLSTANTEPQQPARFFPITRAQMHDPNYDRTAFREWIAATAGTSYDAECVRVAGIMQAALASADNAQDSTTGESNQIAKLPILEGA